MLPSKVKHYGNEEVVLLDREHDIKGYGGDCFCDYVFVYACKRMCLVKKDHVQDSY